MQAGMATSRAVATAEVGASNANSISLPAGVGTLSTVPSCS